MYVRLAEELSEGARQAVALAEHAGDEAAGGELVEPMRSEAQRKKEHDAFERGLVELARTTR